MIPKKGVHADMHDHTGTHIAPSSQTPRKQPAGPRDPRKGFAGPFKKGPQPKTITNPLPLTPVTKSGTVIYQ